MTETSTVIQVTTDHVSVNALKAMAVGQRIFFVLPVHGKLKSARTTCSNMRLQGFRFRSQFDVEKCGILIERTA